MPLTSNITSGQVFWVPVQENNRLYIFSGIAEINWQDPRGPWHRTDDDDWAREDCFIHVNDIREAPKITREQWEFTRGTALASPASIEFRETRKIDTVGFSVNSAVPDFRSLDDPYHSGEQDYYGINLELALRGNDAFFYRISFQLNLYTQNVG